MRGRPNLGSPRTSRKKERRIWGTTEWSCRPPSHFAAPHDATIETLLFPCLRSGRRTPRAVRPLFGCGYCEPMQ